MTTQRQRHRKTSPASRLCSWNTITKIGTCYTRGLTENCLLVFKQINIFIIIIIALYVLASSAGGPAFNPQSRTASYQRRYKNGTSSAIVYHWTVKRENTGSFKRIKIRK